MQKTIESIKIQTFKNFEVWIIDGKSNEETQKYLQTLKAPFFYKSDIDKGIYDAMNKGVLLVKGDWLYFLGSGDYLKTNHVLEIVSKNIDLKSDILMGNITYEEKNEEVFKTKWSYILWLKNTAHHQSIFYSRNVFKKYTYNTHYKILADYDLNLQLYSNKIKVKNIDEIIAICDIDGISKKYTWQLYKEEINLKTHNSSLILRPVFYLLAISKFLFRKLVK